MSRKDLSGLLQAITDSPGMDSDDVADAMNCAKRTATKHVKRLLDQGKIFRQKDCRVCRYFEVEYARANNIPATIVTAGKTTLWFKKRAKVKTVTVVKKDNTLGDMLMLNKLWPAHEVCR